MTEELDGRLKRAAVGMILLGPLGALLGAATKANPLDGPAGRGESPDMRKREFRRDRRVFIALCVLGLIIVLGGLVR